MNGVPLILLPLVVYTVWDREADFAAALSSCKGSLWNAALLKVTIFLHKIKLNIGLPSTFV